MKIRADFHVHSRYSAATSPALNIKTLDQYARMKGVNVIGTGDFTHPEYFRELKENLEPAEGLYRLKESADVFFMLTVEVSAVFIQGGRERRVHLLLTAPSFDAAEKINRTFSRWADLSLDGRPTLKVHAREILKAVLDQSPESLVIPTHIWTPWYSLFGSEFGLESLEECFGVLSKEIAALETGLDSDPLMNRRVSGLDRLALISSSDAHSPSKIGREVTIFDCEPDYHAIVRAIRSRNPKSFLGTIESFSPKGKYFWDGHRKCRVRRSPEESFESRLCSVCGKKTTLGVASQIAKFCDRTLEDAARIPHAPFRQGAGLEELIAESFDVSEESVKTAREYERMIQLLGPELDILYERDLSLLQEGAHPAVLEAIRRMREGQIQVDPGYDGLFGRVRFFDKGEREKCSLTAVQAELF